MSAFEKPPTGSSVRKELMKGRILQRQGKNGIAQLRRDEGRKKWIVLSMHDRKWMHFDELENAMTYFRTAVGETAKG